MSFQLLKVREDQFNVSVHCTQCGQMGSIPKPPVMWGERIEIVHKCPAAQ